jgi:hypothetical protein
VYSFKDFAAGIFTSLKKPPGVSKKGENSKKDEEISWADVSFFPLIIKILV